jgi:hypothetical protein
MSPTGWEWCGRWQIPAPGAGKTVIVTAVEKKQLLLFNKRGDNLPQGRKTALRRTS